MLVISVFSTRTRSSSKYFKQKGINIGSYLLTHLLAGLAELALVWNPWNDSPSQNLPTRAAGTSEAARESLSSGHR